jgi:hypothetical protein
MRRINLRTKELRNSITRSTSLWRPWRKGQQGIWQESLDFNVWRHQYLTQSEILSTMKIHKPQKPFSMIREIHLADWFTLANAACARSPGFSNGEVQKLLMSGMYTLYPAWSLPL